MLVGKSPASAKARTTFSEEETEKLYRFGVKKKFFSTAAKRTILKGILGKMNPIGSCFVTSG